MSKQLLYPERQRCRSCRNFLTPLVVKGQYCSYECAGVPDPAKVPYAQWPRMHITKPSSYPPKAKRYFFSQAVARQAAEAEHKEAYECTFCWHWHIGTSRSEKK